MKNVLALTIALVLGTSGVAMAGMQGQGASPDAKKPEYKEPNPGPYQQRDDAKASTKGSPGPETDPLPKSKQAQKTQHKGQKPYHKRPGRTPGGQMKYHETPGRTPGGQMKYHETPGRTPGGQMKD